MGEKRPDARDLFDAMEAAMVEGFDTISLQAGKLWIGDSAFDAEAVLSALQAQGNGE